MARYYAETDMMRRAALMPLDALDVERIDAVKALGEQLHRLVDSMGPSREISLAKTKIEEAVMWATKAITA